MIGFIPLTLFVGKNKADFSLLTIGSLKWQRSFLKILWKREQYFLIHAFWFLNYERKKVRKVIRDV